MRFFLRKAHQNFSQCSVEFNFFRKPDQLQTTVELSFAKFCVSACRNGFQRTITQTLDSINIGLVSQ